MLTVEAAEAAEACEPMLPTLSRSGAVADDGASAEAAASSMDAGGGGSDATAASGAPPSASSKLKAVAGASVCRFLAAFEKPEPGVEWRARLETDARAAPTPAAAPPRPAR